MKRILLSLIIISQVNIIFGQSSINPYEKYYKSIKWREIGPYRGGRSCAVTGVNNKPNLYYMGSTGGGVWKTTNSGDAWTNISDGYFGGSIGCISVSEIDANIIYVGTGEETVRGNVSSGNGIWKSDDAGKSWMNIGLQNTKHISRIRIHPKNSDIVLVAAMGNIYTPSPERGIYKSIDGGKNWKRTLFASDSAGAIDLVIDPNNPKICYANLWQFQRTPYSLSSGGNHSSLYKSIDGGENWINLKRKKGLPKGIWGISTISICQSKPDRLYAMIENDNGGLFRSDDSGETWERVNESRDLRQRAWYFSRIQADPNNADIVYVQNVSFHKSTDGGKTFQTINTGHADHHDHWIDPNQSDRMIIGNDGGAQISHNGGNTWSSLYNQPTAQFYRVTTDNSFPYRIYCAQQDNSTVRIKHRTNSNRISQQDWESTAGGESGHIAVDPINPEIVYGGSYGGYLTRFDHGKNISRSINVWPDNPIGHGAENLKFRFQWNFPILFSPHDPKKIYTASNHLHVSTNEGHSWQTISPDLTTNDKTKQIASGGPITKDNTSVEYYCTIFAISESSVKKDLIWTGSDDGLIHITQDGGKNWKNVTPSLLPKFTMINCIDTDPFDAGTCYVAATSYKSGDFKPYLIKTENFGQTWSIITNGIPELYFSRVIRADLKTKGLLYAGTENGMYVSYNSGKMWYPLQLNLPLTPITDIALKNGSLIVSTQGRGIWMIDDLNPIRESYSTTKNNIVFTPQECYRNFGSSTSKVGAYGTNLSSEIMLYFYLDSLYDQDTLMLSLLTGDGDTVSIASNYPKSNQDKITASSGSNLVPIRYQFKPAKTFDDMILWWSSLSGPTAYPGIYQLHFKSTKIKEKVSVEIKKDPRYPVTDDDVKKHFNFIKAIRDKTDEAHKCIIQMRDVKKQISSLLERTEKTTQNDSLWKLYKIIDTTMNSIENELYQTKNKSGQDPINFPIKLTNKLAHLTALYNGDSYPPTEQAEAYRKEVSELIDQQLKKFESLNKNEIQQFNKLIHEFLIEIIKIKKIE
jgi:photosystem II stability/assembly factor-like uncharacterized protein